MKEITTNNEIGGFLEDLSVNVVTRLGCSENVRASAEGRREESAVIELTHHGENRGVRQRCSMCRGAFLVDELDDFADRERTMLPDKIEALDLQRSDYCG